MTDHHQALAEVRRAYRYVQLYQQRVLDAFASLGSTLRPLGFEPWYWTTQSNAFSRTPRSLPGVAEAWFPGLDFEMTWTHGSQAEKGVGTYVIARHIADTRPASLTTEESDSVVQALVVRPTHGFKEAWQTQHWSTCLKEHFAEDVMADVVRPMAGQLRPPDPKTGFLWRAVVSLGSLREQDDLGSLVLTPVAEAASHAIALT